MAITSAGYDGTVDEVQWAALIPSAGSSEYGVLGSLDFNVTAHPTTAYAVNVSAGTAWGHGVLDVSDSVVAVQCDAPAAGVIRWDLICARRDWRPLAGGPTSITKVNGGATADIPAGRNNTPGTVDDQPLFLVQWTGGQTQPTAYIDLRCWAGNGGLTARNDKVRSYLTRIGTQIEILGVQWQRRVDGTGSAEWVKLGQIGAIPIFGAGNPRLGSAPAAGTQFLVQSGTSVSNADASGYGRITFPVPFPNGVLYAKADDGDASIDTARGTSISLPLAGYPDWPNAVFLGSFVYAVMDRNGAKLPGALHRADWIVIGW